jgi:hypothetical protein
VGFAIHVARLGHSDPFDRSNFRVLVPGAGLGRLAWDVARLGQRK